MDRQELSDAVWERISPHLPGKATEPGRTGRDNRPARHGCHCRHRCQPVVPRRTITAKWRSFDATFYKDRNLIKRFFNKIKHFRRIATRYDKLALRRLPQPRRGTPTLPLNVDPS